MRHCKKSYRRLPRFTVRKRFMYHGYEIVIMRNGSPYFRFEWVINPPKQMPRGLARFEKPFTDPTSHVTIKSTVYTAKCEVNEMRTPFWLKYGH